MRVIKREGERVANSGLVASLLSVGSCRNCCILSGGGCVVACLAYFSAAWPSAWIIDFHCPPKVALSPSLSHTHWTGNSYCCRLAFICQLIPLPTLFSLRPSLSLTNTKERQFIRLSVCLFVCWLRHVVYLFVAVVACNIFSSPPRSSASWFLLLHLPLRLPPQLALFFQAVAYQFIFVHSHLRVLLSLIPIPIAPIRSCSPHPPLFPLFLLCNLCFTFPRTAFQLLLFGICFGLVACFDFNPVQTHFVVAMALWPWSLTRAALTLCRFIQHVYKYILCTIILVYIFNVHNTLALQGICNANVTLELYVAWP